MKSKPLDNVLGLHAVHKIKGDVKATFDTFVRSRLPSSLSPSSRYPSHAISLVSLVITILSHSICARPEAR